MKRKAGLNPEAVAHPKGRSLQRDAERHGEQGGSSGGLPTC